MARAQGKRLADVSREALEELSLATPADGGANRRQLLGHPDSGGLLRHATMASRNHSGRNRGRKSPFPLATGFATELHETPADSSQLDSQAPNLNETGGDQPNPLNGQQIDREPMLPSSSPDFGLCTDSGSVHPRPTERACRDQSIDPLGTIHWQDCPVTSAMRSKSVS
jgi:hypothetical protein